MQKFLSISAIFTVFALPVWAEGNVIFAECGEGGCSCLLTDLTEEEARITLGEDPPEGEGEAVLVGSEGSLSWTRMSVEDLDLLYGGSGECELALFPAIIPADGTWLGTIGARTIGANCPAGVEAMVNPQLDALARAAQMQWGGVFDPTKMSGTGPNNIQWEMVHENLFTGTMPMPDLGAAGNINVAWESEILDEGYIRSEVVMDILGICDVNAVVDFRRTGP